MTGHGTQSSGLSDKVGISHVLDLMTLEVFPNPKDSVMPTCKDQQGEGQHWCDLLPSPRRCQSADPCFIQRDAEVAFSSFRDGMQKLWMNCDFTRIRLGI